MEAEARIETRGASDFLRQLPEGLKHTWVVRFDPLTAEIILPDGQLVLTADADRLTIRLISNDLERLDALKNVAAKHVRRLDAKLQEFLFDWQKRWDGARPKIFRLSMNKGKLYEILR